MTRWKRAASDRADRGCGKRHSSPATSTPIPSSSPTGMATTSSPISRRRTRFEKIDLSAVTAIDDFDDLVADPLSQVGPDVLIETGGGDRDNVDAAFRSGISTPAISCSEPRCLPKALPGATNGPPVSRPRRSKPLKGIPSEDEIAGVEIAEGDIECGDAVAFACLDHHVGPDLAIWFERRFVGNPQSRSPPRGRFFSNGFVASKSVMTSSHARRRRRRYRR